MDKTQYRMGAGVQNRLALPLGGVANRFLGAENGHFMRQNDFPGRTICCGDFERYFRTHRKCTIKGYRRHQMEVFNKKSVTFEY